MNDDNEKTYRPYLNKYMSFLNNTVYEKEYVFSVDELLTATPESIARWMRVQAFGKEVISQTDRCLRRASTVAMYKKGLSYFMPHKSPWNLESKFGNPTKSKEVNDLIKYIKKEEVRNRGQESQVKRPLTQSEFRAALTILSCSPQFRLQYRVTTMMKFQYNLVTRCDELGHFKIKDLKSHSNPSFRLFALEIKVYWSKNVHEERHCPNQIILGSMDNGYYILLSLAIYLEHWFTNYNGLQKLFLFSDDIDNEKAPSRTKSFYSNNLRRNVFLTEAFKTATGTRASNKLGSHSLRKYPATWASRNDCTMEEVDVRG